MVKGCAKRRPGQREAPTMISVPIFNNFAPLSRTRSADRKPINGRIGNAWENLGIRARHICRGYLPLVIGPLSGGAVKKPAIKSSACLPKYSCAVLPPALRWISCMHVVLVQCRVSTLRGSHTLVKTIALWCCLLHGRCLSFLWADLA